MRTPEHKTKLTKDVQREDNFGNVAGRDKHQHSEHFLMEGYVLSTLFKRRSRSIARGIIDIQTFAAWNAWKNVAEKAMRDTYPGATCHAGKHPPGTTPTAWDAQHPHSPGWACHVGSLPHPCNTCNSLWLHMQRPSSFALSSWLHAPPMCSASSLAPSATHAAQTL